MEKAYKILTVIVLLSTSCFAQYEQEAMYNCYLSSDKQLWKQYVTTSNWNQMSNSERQRLLNYEYGYIAYAISAKENNVKQLLFNFNEHLEQMEGKMPESTRLTYLSAAASYYISISKITILSNGPKTFSYAEKAVQTNPNDPYALTLRGSLYFYCPSAFGGDKRLALDYLRKAEKQFEMTGDTLYNWNYRAVQMVIAQCYEKIGNKEKAIEKCHSILSQEPEFAYIRDSYLPELLGTKTKDGNNPNNVGASFVSSFGE